MVERTDTVLAPWTIVAAEQKRFARIKVLETVIQSIEGAPGVDDYRCSPELTKS